MNYFIAADWNKIIDKIEKGERKKNRLQEIKEMIQEKIERHLEKVYLTMYPGMSKGMVPQEELQKYSPWDLLMYSWSTMQFKYANVQKGWTYRQEEDAFLLTMMHRHGYGAFKMTRFISYVMKEVFSYLSHYLLYLCTTQALLVEFNSKSAGRGNLDSTGSSSLVPLKKFKNAVMC